MAEQRLLYRVPEAAEVLGLSRAKVNQLISRGDLGSIKIDGARRIPSEALHRFVDDRRPSAVAGTEVSQGVANGRAA